MDSNQTSHPHVRKTLYWEGMRERCWSCHVLLALVGSSGEGGVMQPAIEELSDGLLLVRCTSCQIINLFRSL